MMTSLTPESGQDSIESWNALLRPLLKERPDFPKKFLQGLQDARLTFGNRVHCPFLRPFFISTLDEARVRHATETLARLGERVATAAMEDNSLFAQFHLRPEEERLVRLPAGKGPASTASRVDAFLLTESVKFTEYNGESPAGSGYTETLSAIFRELPVMKEFAEQFEVHSYPLSALLLDALIGTYRDWGGTAQHPQMLIVDWKEVPTWSEFEILKERFEAMRVPVVLADPRELEWDGKSLLAKGKKIDLVYRRVLINDIVARPKECAALVKAYEAQAVCVANNFRCKIPHVKAFFAVLTEQKNAKLFSSEELDVIRKHVPWTRVVEDVKTDYQGTPIELLEQIPLFKGLSSNELGRIARSFKMWLSALMDMTSQYLEVLVVGLVLGPTAAGFYFVATRITNVFAMISGSITIYATSQISGLFHANAKDELQTILRSLAVISTIVVAVTVAVILLAGQLLLSLFGIAYVAAYPVLIVLAVGASIVTLAGPAAYLLLLTGNEGAYPRIMACGLTLRFALIAILGPLFGLMGAAIAWSISAVVIALTLVIASRRLVGLDPSPSSAFARAARPIVPLTGSTL